MKQLVEMGLEFIRINSGYAYCPCYKALSTYVHVGEDYGWCNSCPCVWIVRR